jgi:hypothetical protein
VHDLRLVTDGLVEFLVRKQTTSVEGEDQMGLKTTTEFFRLREMSGQCKRCHSYCFKCRNSTRTYTEAIRTVFQTELEEVGYCSRPKFSVRICLAKTTTSICILYCTCIEYPFKESNGSVLYIRIVLIFIVQLNSCIVIVPTCNYPVTGQCPSIDCTLRS